MSKIVGLSVLTEILLPIKIRDLDIHKWVWRYSEVIIYAGAFKGSNPILILMLLVANLANAKRCKNPEK